MRVRLVIDGASTEEVRAIAAAVSRERADALVLMIEVGCDGPERWRVHTPDLDAQAVARVLESVTFS